MLRHEFRPGKLVIGLFLVAAGVAYAGDAGGLWVTEWFAAIPLVLAGLVLAGVVAGVNGAIRRRRRVGRRGKGAPRRREYVGVTQDPPAGAGAPAVWGGPGGPP
ncbi:hypothetical protein, partial [Streptomyces hokutonensis]|uniref:hypothetical protein n=1 Tax=Streptomyces hokutonensis TaxID=1306990 RepID=UPI003697781F